MSDIKSKLLVPMALEALVVSQDRTDCVDLGPQWNAYQNNNKQSFLGNVLQARINKSLTLEKGVHIHWSLPKALKHSFVDDENDMQFPYAPNRWMVTRLRTDQGITDIPSRIWMVESDAETTNSIPNWSLVENNKLIFKNIGKNLDWSNDYNEDTSKSILHTVGAANPLFASFYPSCKNVFGFHDNMEDVTDEKATFTYIVTGWYNKPALDPLNTSNKELNLNWFHEKWEYTTDEYPTSSFFHSTIHSLQWSTNQLSGVPSAPVQVYAGNTAVESLSAQIIQSANIKDDNIDTLLNALQYELLENNTNPPGLLKIKTEVHKRGFSPKNRNSIWEVARKEADDAELEENKEKRIQFPNDLKFLADLKELNNKQIQVNILSEELLSIQQEYYFLWYKKALKDINNYTVVNFDYENAKENLLNKIVALKVDIETLSTEIKSSIDKLNASPYLSGSEAEFELKEKLEDRFWESNDPVLLLCGDGVGDTNTPTFQSSETKIKCRTIDQLVQAFSLDVDTLNSPISVEIKSTSFTIPTISTLSNPQVPFETIKKLIHESILLDQAFSLDIALLAYKEAQLGEGKTKDSIIIKKFAEETVIPAQSNPIIVGEGILPDMFSVIKWKQAWTPLFMAWEGVYTPSDESIKNLDVLTGKNWTLNQDKLSFQNTSATAANQKITFQGISPFTNAVFSNLKRLIPEHIVDRYGKLNVIAQSISGFNKHLIMQKPDVQLPPFIYKATPDGRDYFNTSYEIDTGFLNTIGENAYTLGANPGNINGSDSNIFFPYRSGFLKITNLSIVDSFGQVKKVILPDKQSVQVKTTTQTEGDHGIPLPPRIIQPSRLRFNWLNEKEEIIYQDTGKLDPPIFGWLVPNYLDNSIMVYDGNGKEIQILQITRDNTKEHGLRLSKIPFPGDETIPDISDNTQLSQLLNAIDTGSIATGIKDLASKVNTSLTQAKGAGNSAITMIFGQPIALATCSIGLESLGKLANNQRWDQSGKENTGGIETVKFPLFIGDYLLENDGLLGYFPIDDYKHLYTTVNAPEFAMSESESFFKADTALQLTLNGTPQKVVLLIDSSAGIHLSTGILPTKFVELLHYNSNELIESLNVTFMVAPFIAEQVDPGIPIPTSINANWKWTHQSEVTTWQEISEGKNKQQANFQKQQIYEGWLKLDHLKNNN
jgi:hypothetical protein